MAFFKLGMPVTGVYLVKPASIAAFAASLMCCGVSKSGSPAASPIIGRPSALYLPAFAVIAKVGDSLIANTRVDNGSCDEFAKIDFLNAFNY